MCSCCDPAISCLVRTRGTIARVCLWGGMISICAGFAFLYTFCNDKIVDNSQCGPLSNYKGIIFIFLIFLNYLLYTVIKDSIFCCVGPISCCDPSHVTRSVEPMPTVTVQPEVGDDVRMADLEGNYNFDLPTFEEALQMEKIDVPTMGKVNEAFEELPPEYEPPSYSPNMSVNNSDSPMAPPSDQITLSENPVDPIVNESGSTESLRHEFQPVEDPLSGAIEEERTVTPIIPNSNQF